MLLPIPKKVYKSTSKALGKHTERKRSPFREGVLNLAEKKLDVFFVTLNKSEKDYSPSTIKASPRFISLREAFVSLGSNGKWSASTGKWLEESVDFSQSRANKLMRIFKEYGAEQLTSSNSDSNPNPNLNYSQAVLLLGIPKEERAQFIIDMDIEGMTNQELRKAVNERTQTLKQKK
ncbi:Protein export cytoplasm protein SecA ATPase RNA helicase [Desulfosporosinus sp. I2]|uniref:DUF3102 domain-containing protein n=1 Tax=Desulfosporosinus sp. I2 TaxID=1617025 RepID=UPI00061E5CB2|nr:DUF3102 domain-containing protein [Desulfosporosinus sp. I2]KJR45973.1 Protein export cytoplasm protein SecA ATPase RNA helicase [Desulfosporosinus sp. I2]